MAIFARAAGCPQGRGRIMAFIAENPVKGGGDNMDIIHGIGEHFDEICDMAYDQYCKEAHYHTLIPQKSKPGFEAFFRQNLPGFNCIAATENGRCIGFLLYSLQNMETVRCAVPVWGSGSNAENPEKVIGFLFQILAEQVVSDKVDFLVSFYAHDDKLQRLFSFMQFGIMAEISIRHITKKACPGQFKIRELPKNEIVDRWGELWELLTQLIGHLRKSPVFYPGVEFTEEVYKELFTALETKVYVAEEGRKIIGLIEANAEKTALYAELPMANVAEAYVLPAYRGTKLAQALLYYLDNDLLANHVEYEWVGHGTANPHARGFWNKYFDTFAYLFVRSIKAPPAMGQGTSDEDAPL